MAAQPVALITGASRGIGLAVARIFLEHNASVVAVSRSSPPELRELATKYPDQLVAVQGSVTDPDIISQAVSTAKDKFGGLDALVLNAGIVDPLARIADTSGAPLDKWKDHFDVNFFSLVLALQHATPLLRQSTATGGGKVIFVSSGAAVGGTAGWGPYNAGKAAMNSLARTYASEEPSVTSIAFRPGVVATDMQVLIRCSGSDAMLPADHKKFIDLHEHGKLASPDVPASVIVRLALEASKDLSGQFVNIDGPECAPYKK